MNTERLTSEAADVNGGVAAMDGSAHCTRLPQDRPADVEHGLAVANLSLPGGGDVSDESRAGVIDDGARVREAHPCANDFSIDCLD